MNNVIEKLVLNLSGHYVEEELPKEFKLIHEKLHNYDSCFVEVWTYEVVIQRISDGKFFQNFYDVIEKESDRRWSYDKWIQVFPKQITVYK